MHRHLPAILFFLLPLLMPRAAQATHYLGGEMTYAALGNNQYNVFVRIYRDCHHGEPGAIDEDVPVFVSVFTGSGTRVQVMRLYASSITNLLPGTLLGCLRESDHGACVIYTECAGSVTLPPSADGYILVNDRCCMPADITNVNDANQMGIALRVTIPNTVSIQNSSPTFRAAPPLRVCAGMPLTLDFGATDANGDTLRYALVEALRGTSTYADPKPEPYTSSLDPVPLAGGYTVEAPAGLGNAVVLNATTGLLTGTIYTPGTYLISVRASEYRAGSILGNVRRTYALQVVPCEQETDAAIVRDDAAIAISMGNISIIRCAGQRTVQFQNASTGAVRYLWDFGDAGSSSDTSSLAEPSYTYPAAGQYSLTLIAYGADCNDTLRTLVVMSDDAVPVVDFSSEISPLCAGQSYYFNSAVADPTLPAQSFVWRFVATNGDGEAVMAYGTPVQYTVSQPGTLHVQHSVITLGGCVGTVTRDVPVRDGNVQVSNDTVVVEGAQLFIAANGGSQYEWQPLPPAAFVAGASLSAQQQQVYTGKADTALRFVCFSTGVNGCLDYDTVRIDISKNAYAFVPTAFSPNGDGLNDVLRPRLAGANLKSFSIYSRYGQEVYHTTSHGSGWDGTFRGQRLGNGTYYWMVRVQPPAGDAVLTTGDVTLVR